MRQFSKLAARKTVKNPKDTCINNTAKTRGRKLKSLSVFYYIRPHNHLNYPQVSFDEVVVCLVAIFYIGTGVYILVRIDKRRIYFTLTFFEPSRHFPVEPNSSPQELLSIGIQKGSRNKTGIYST